MDSRAESGMDATVTYFKLKNSGIRPYLNNSRDQLHVDPADSITRELANALAANQEHMVKEELLREVARFVCGRIREGDRLTAGDHEYSPAAQAAFGAMARSQERISDAMNEQACETFKETLRQWCKTALRTYETARTYDRTRANESTSEAAPETLSAATDEPPPAQLTLPSTKGETT